MDSPEPAVFQRIQAERTAYKEAFRDAFIAYLKGCHGRTGAEALAEADRVMAETERRIKDDPRCSAKDGTLTCN